MEDGFALIPNRVMVDNSLKDCDKLVYGIVYGLCSVQGYSWASNRYIAERLYKSESTISRAISNLVKNGYLTLKLLQEPAQKTGMVTQRNIYLTDKGIKNDDLGTQKCIGEVRKNDEYNIKNNIKNLHSQSSCTKEPTKKEEPTSKQPSLTVQIDNILNEKLDKLEKEGSKVIRVSIPIQRKIIKNSLTLFDNDVEWIKAYISKALCDDFVAKSCYMATVLFCKAVIAKYIKVCKPVRYSEKAPEYVPTEADRAFEAMTPEERSAWIRKEKKRIRDEMEARK